MLIKIKKTNKLILIVGESNSGGIALNSDASSNELLPANDFRIFNNDTALSFDKMQFGINNLIAHRGLESYFTTRHGMELGLLNYYKENHFRAKRVLLLKFGQGGTRARHWIDNDTYIDIQPWKVFWYRLKRLKSLISLKDYDIKILISLGINDGIDGTDPATFKTKYKQFMTNLRASVGVNAPIFATQIMSTYSAINDKIVECNSEITNFNAVSVVGAGLQDSNHWNYSGFKLIIDRMVESGL